MLIVLIALPVAAAFAIAALARIAPGQTRVPGAVMALASLAGCALLVSELPGILDGGVVGASWEWVPELGWPLAFRLDGLSMLFGLMITGIGTLIGWYGRAYMGDDERNARFFATLLIFQAGMLIAVLADGFAVLYIGWEITSISSFALIGFQHANPEARRSAQHALVVTTAGGLAMLGGLILLGVATEEWQFSTLTREGVEGIDPALAGAALALILLGAFTKSAQFPFHGWLPGAMTAPTPVSAYLHSATMVKLGVYLLARSQPALGGLAMWGAVVPVVGGITMVLGAILAVRERDLKRVLAYSTVSALGWMVMLAGFGTTDALKALAVTIIGHAAYKAALFMTAGTIDHETGTRDRFALGGLRRAMPLLGISAGVAAVSMAGLPPALGFLAKETTIAAGFEEDGAWIIAGSVAVMGALTLVAAFAAGVAPFLGQATETPKHAHEGPLALWAPVALLATFGIVIGVAGPALLPPFLDQVVTASYGSPYETHLTFFTGFDAIFLTSALAIGGGAVFVGFHRAMPSIPWIPATTPGVLQGILDGLTRLAEGVERRTQHGSLPVYIATAITIAVVPLLAVVVHAGPLQNLSIEAAPLPVAMATVVAIGAFAAARSQTRIRSIAALGATGFGITLVYLYFGAPDLAMTQALVETLTVILFIFAFRHLPIRPGGGRDLRRHYSGLAIGSIAGLAVTGLTLLLVEPGRPTHLREFFEAASYPDARGTNVVNTILVDFRALDTLGEISVLAVAALGILALLRLTGRSAARIPRADDPQVLRTAARAILPLLIVFAFFLFLRGHDQPGGGFVAGLVAAAGVALYAMAYDARTARRLLRVPPRTLMAAGLVMAVGAAAFGTWGAPPLTGHWTDVPLPGNGELKVGTPLFFDFGVFLVVLGVASALATALLEEQR